MTPQIPSPPSLWRELVEGTASAGTRLVVTLALAAGLLGAALVAAFVLSWMIHVPIPTGGRQTSVYVREEMVAWVLVIASLLFILGTVWIWTRGQSRFRAVFQATGASVAIAVAGSGLAALAGDSFYGDEEFIVAGILFVTLAAILLVCVLFWRRAVAKRPFHNPVDGQIDLRCPQCGYRMVGLREARCPECGTVYTLDELLTCQHFAPPQATAAPTLLADQRTPSHVQALNATRQV